MRRAPRKTKDWFERAKLVVAAARERAVETSQQRAVPSMKRFPTVLQRRRLAERLSANSAAGIYLGTGLILAFLVQTHYPGALGLREWIRVVLSWPLIFFLRSK